ncbi:MAG: hypothetical protein AB1941_01310 [Gemmatimonadota bacterium]
MHPQTASQTPRAPADPRPVTYGSLTHDPHEKPEPASGAGQPLRSSCHLSMGRKETR